MNLTNLHGLPEAVVAAVRNDSYVGGGDISATKLIDTPQRRVLQRQFKESVVEDVSERIWALLGQLAHLLLERANTNDLVEQRLYMNVNGWELSGQFDHVHLGEKMLSDYKLTSVFKAEGYEEWEKQLNVLRLLCHENGYVVDRLQIIAIFRDWRRSEMTRNPDYPKVPIKVIEVPVWDLDKTRAYVEERVGMHQAADRGEQVPCTDEERWHAGTTYALIKEGGKRASKVAHTKEEIGDPPKGYIIEERNGGYRRCENFCTVAPFCKQYQSELGATKNDDDH